MLTGCVSAFSGCLMWLLCQTQGRRRWRGGGGRGRVLAARAWGRGTGETSRQVLWQKLNCLNLLSEGI